MKRMLAVILTAVLLLSFVPAVADVDLSGMTIEELIVLKQQINYEISKRPEIKSVTVPIGVWKIGEDIPAGHWSITTAEGYTFDWSMVLYCSELNETGKDGIRRGAYYEDMVKCPGSGAYTDNTSIDIDMKEGMYVIISHAPVVFTPFTGKPDLGFDW